MPRKFFRRYAPSHRQVREHKHLKCFGALLREPNLWQFHRRSVSGAFAVGLFWAFIPIPMQMVASAGFAILFRVNLPLSLLLVWITNPFTMPPIFYASYRVGVWLLDTSPVPDFVLSWEWISQSSAIIWTPLIVGSVVCGAVSALIGFTAVRLIWRFHLINYLRRRAMRKRRSRRAPGSSPEGNDLGSH